MKVLEKAAVAIATGLGTGYSPYAPGTCGTLAAIPLYLALSQASPWIYMIFAAALAAAGTWAAGVAGKKWGAVDDQRIVIDEVAGFLVTMAFTKPSLVAVLVGFVLFRLFDISKPFPVSWADGKVKNAFGVMLDDLLAGLYGLAAMQTIPVAVKKLSIARLVW
jgi:phosphatidylglycerophosphatase A